MKVFDILHESMSSVLFHFTSFGGAQAILSTNQLKAKRNGEISFTRSLHGSYPKTYKLIGVTFEFDGNLLNQKFKGKSVGTEEIDDDFEIIYTGKRNGQLEDRLFVRKDGILNVRKYIKRAFIYLPKEYLDNKEDMFDEPYKQHIANLTGAMDELRKARIPTKVAKTEKELNKFR